MIKTGTYVPVFIQEIGTQVPISSSKIRNIRSFRGYLRGIP